jgi:hypothetical protein
MVWSFACSMSLWLESGCVYIGFKHFREAVWGLESGCV